MNQQRETALSEAAQNGEKVQAAQACLEAIQEVLKQHNCIITSYILPPEGVGNGSSKVLLTTSWGVQEKKNE